MSAVVAVAVRDQVAAVVLLEDGNVARVRRVHADGQDAQRLRRVVQAVADDYSADDVVAEKTQPLIRALDGLSPQPAFMNLAAAKERLVGDLHGPHNLLYREILERLPALARFTPGLLGPVDAAVTPWRQAVVLIAAALGVAATGSDPSIF